MSFPPFVARGPLSIKGQVIKMFNNGSGSATHSYTVSVMYGKPVSAIWYGDELQFSTDKGKSFIAKNNSTIRELK